MSTPLTGDARAAAIAAFKKGSVPEPKKTGPRAALSSPEPEAVALRWQDLARQGLDAFLIDGEAKTKEQALAYLNDPDRPRCVGFLRTTRED